MPALHISDVPEGAESQAKAGSRRLDLRTVATGKHEPFDRADFYEDDEG